MTEEIIPTNGTSAEDVAYAKKVKEIYIDGVNAAGCEHLTEIEGCWLSTCDYLPYKGNITNQLCKYNDNCYYKQLKRLEQENEKLKESLKMYQYSDQQHLLKVIEYEKALEEIREIADVIYNTNCNYVAEAHKILDKINEILDKG